MRRSIGGVVLVLALAIAATGCDPDDPNPPTTPTDPLDPVTETFTGTINTNGAVTFFFPARGAGLVSGKLLSLTPDTTIGVSLALGTWNGQLCQVTLANDAAIQGSTVTGAVSGVGTLCVRLSDIGQITQLQTFEIVVVHP